MKRGSVILLVVCALAVIASGVAVVYAKYSSRKYFVELQELRAQKDALDIEWGRLRLEQGTRATDWRIEKIARERLDMHMPSGDEVIVISP